MKKCQAFFPKDFRSVYKYRGTNLYTKTKVFSPVQIEDLIFIIQQVNNDLKKTTKQTKTQHRNKKQPIGKCLMNPKPPFNAPSAVETLI